MSEVSSGFLKFWSVWPRKQAKLQAIKAWHKMDCEAQTDKIVAAVQRQKRYWTEPKFIPHPATWLNGGRWDDDPVVEIYSARPAPVITTPAPPPQQDGWKANLNRVLLDLIGTVNGVPDDVLVRLLKGRDYYAAQFHEMWGQEAPKEEFADVMVGITNNFRRVIAGDK